MVDCLGNMYMNYLKKRSGIEAELHDYKCKVRSAKESLAWFKCISKRFRLLEKFYKKRPIVVYNWEQFEADEHTGLDFKGPSSIDLRIELPPTWVDIWGCIKGYFSWILEFKELPKIKDYLPWKFRDRWIFCICTIDCFIDSCLDDPLMKYYDIIESKPSYKNSVIPHFHQIRSIEKDDWLPWLRANLPNILSTGPIITYDDVWTGKKFLTQEDALHYTRLWLQKWYPNLAKRPIKYGGSGMVIYHKENN